MTDTTVPTRALHARYLSLTGLDIPFSMPLHYRLEAFIAQGGTADDLALVVAYIKRRIKQHKRERESLLPRNLFSNYSNFCEDLSMARAEVRAPRTDPAREAVLAATGRPDVADSKTKPVSDIMAGMKALHEFRQWRQGAGL